MDWLTPLFSLTMSFDHGVSMDYLPLLAVELEDSKLWLENFELALRCWYSIFLDRFVASFKVYRVFKDTWSPMETHSPCTNLDTRCKDTRISLSICIGLFFLTILDIYNDYFKGCHTRCKGCCTSCYMHCVTGDRICPSSSYFL